MNRNYYYLLTFLLLFSTMVFAEQKGTSEFMYISKDSACLNEYKGTFEAGDSIYVKVNFTNTGDVKLVDAVTFLIDSISHRIKNYKQDENGNWIDFVYRNYGHYSTTRQYFDLDVGESSVKCLKLDTFETQVEGEWKVWIYFRNSLSVSVASTKVIYYNLTENPTTPSLNFSYDTNFTRDEIIPLNTKNTYWINFTNRNLDNPYTGMIQLRNLYFKDTGLSYKKVTFDKGETKTFMVENPSFSEPLQQYVGFYFPYEYSTYDPKPKNLISQQKAILEWRRFFVEGDYYKFLLKQLYLNKSYYLPGERGKVYVQVSNIGNTEWNTSNNMSIYVRAKNSSGNWNDLLFEKKVFSTPQSTGTTSWYDSIDFENNLDNIITEIYVEFNVYDQDDQKSWRYGSNAKIYSKTEYPDITDDCTRVIYNTPWGKYENLTCTATNGVVFVKKPVNGLLKKIDSSSGTLNSFWEDIVDGEEGYYLGGSINSVYQISHQILDKNKNIFGCDLINDVYSKYGSISKDLVIETDETVLCENGSIIPYNSNSNENHVVLDSLTIKGTIKLINASIILNYDKKLEINVSGIMKLYNSSITSKDDTFDITNGNHTLILEKNSEVKIINSTLEYQDAMIIDTDNFESSNMTVLKSNSPIQILNNYGKFEQTKSQTGFIINNTKGINILDSFFWIDLGSIIKNSNITIRNSLFYNSTKNNLLINNSIVNLNNITFVNDSNIKVDDSEITFLDSDANSIISSKVNSVIIQDWTLHFNVTKSFSGLPVYYTNIKAKDNLNYIFSEGYTDEKGGLNLIVREYVENKSKKSNLNNYTFILSQPKYKDKNITLNITNTTYINISLETTKGIIPETSSCFLSKRKFCAKKNPKNCSNMVEGDSCDITFTINATSNSVQKMLNQNFSFFSIAIPEFDIVNISESEITNILII